MKTLSNKKEMSQFDIDLAYSLEQRSNEVFNHFYFNHFAKLQRVEMVEYETQPELQLNGVDKILHFNNGNTVTIDEKKRRKNYNDIFLELWSNYNSRNLGWVYTAQCDYIVYFIEPTQKVYILPVLLLQGALRKHRKKWTDKYNVKKTKEKRIIKAVGLPVPPEVLLNAIKEEMDDYY